MKLGFTGFTGPIILGVLASQAAVANPMAAFESLRPGTYEIAKVRVESLDPKSGEILDSRILDSRTETVAPLQDDVTININGPWFPGDPWGGMEDPKPAEDPAPQNILDKIFNYGAKIWKAVVANRPVVKVDYKTANALPEGVSNVRDLEEWQMPRTKLFRITYENLFGAEVVSYTYAMTYTAGGSYDGKGQYLSNINVVSKNLNVLWGYSFNATATVPNVVNMGKKANPLAAAEVQVNWSVETPLKHMEQSEIYWVRGDGAFKEVN